LRNRECKATVRLPARALKLLSEGADMLDVGAYSSRHGAGEVPEAEECRRLENALRVIWEA